MRTGQRGGDVFDALLARGEIVIHPTEIERLAAVTATASSEPHAEPLVVADTREQVALLNAAIRDVRLDGQSPGGSAGALTLTTSTGEQLSHGDRVATRRNDLALGVANRDTWTVAAVGDDGSLLVRGRFRERTLPAEYANRYVELAFATNVRGAQADTVDNAHLLICEATGGASAYVGMTRGRRSNTAHLVAESLEQARAQGVEVFGRDRADLGPAHAAERALEAIDRYGSKPPTTRGPDDVKPSRRRRRPEHLAPSPSPGPSRGVNR